MNVIDYPIMAPGVCFICEMTNPGRYVDTFRSFSPGGVTPLNGRKYVCEYCIGGMADAIGWASPDRYWHLEEICEEAKKDIEKLTSDNAKLLKIAESIELIKEVKNNGSDGNRSKARSNGRS